MDELGKDYGSSAVLEHVHSVDVRPPFMITQIVQNVLRFLDVLRNVNDLSIISRNGSIE